MPSPARVNSDKRLRLLRPLLNKPYLWHLNRRSVARGFACGAFWSMWPIAGQTIPALLITVRTRGNVGIAFAALWLSNPFTLIPHWWSAYLLGRFVLHQPRSTIEITWDSLWPQINTLSRFSHFVWNNFWDFYLPVFVGSLLEGFFLAVAGYLLINTIWKAHTRKRWRESRSTARSAARGKPREPAELASL